MIFQERCFKSYKIRNIFLEKLYTKRFTSEFCTGICKNWKQSSRGVLKKMCSENMQKIYWRTPMPKCNFNKVAKQYSLKFSTVCFVCIPSWGLSKYIETKLQNTCFYPTYSFWKNKKRSGTSFSGPFAAWFLKKNLYHVIFNYLTKKKSMTNKAITKCVRSYKVIRKSYYKVQQVLQSVTKKSYCKV